MEERGVPVDHATIQRWVVKYSPLLEEAFHRRKRPVWVSWRMEVCQTQPIKMTRCPLRLFRQTTRRLVCELKAEGEEESTHAFHKGFAVAKQLHVGRFVSKIDSDGTVCAGLFGYWAHVSPPGHQVSSADETRWGSHVAISRQL
jgi:hypothetical protein